MEMSAINGEPWARVAPSLPLPQLDNLERDGVSIKCLNSSDFVIGRQTNFNGPVTIITCEDVLRQRNNEEDVVIRDKVLSRSAAMEVEKLAMEKSTGGDDQDVAEESSNFWKHKKLLWIFGLVCIGLLLLASAALVFLSNTSIENLLPNCIALSSHYCIFTDFEWGGRPISSSLKPLPTPVSHVIISQTHQDFCYEIPVCLNFVKWLQLNTTAETSCNFYVGGDGNAYEDLGWTWESFLEGPAEGKALQICFMGNHTEEEFLTYPQQTTAQTLIQFGVDCGYISKEYVLAASNSTSSRRYLGSIYRVVKKWPNFSEDPFPRRAIPP